MTRATKRFTWASALLGSAAMLAAGLFGAPTSADDSSECSNGCRIECEVWLPNGTDLVNPTRFINHGADIVVRTGDPVLLKVCARWEPCAPCQRSGDCYRRKIWLGNVARPPFLNPGGHVLDKGRACLRYSQIARNNSQPGCYWIKFLARSYRGYTKEYCNVKICLLPPLCEEPSTCTVDQTSIAAAVGTSSDFIVCAQSGCEGEHAKAKLLNPPGFVWLVGEFTDAEGNCCYHYRIDACTTDAGTHTLEFESYNYGDDKPSGSCSVEVTIAG